MKRIFTFLFGLSLLAGPVFAQEIDESYIFVNADGEVIENGATVIRNEVELFGDDTDVINAGIYVMNLAGSADDYIKMIYDIQRIDNGTYQICFPMSCNMQNEVGIYETASGQLMGDLQDIQSEWFPLADGECVVKLTIEILSKVGFFPNFSYIHKAYGPTITLRFVKGDVPQPGIPGDVNGDGEVNIADVNSVIDAILSSTNNNPAADVNRDGEINIADINYVIDIILNPSH